MLIRGTFIIAQPKLEKRLAIVKIIYDKKSLLPGLDASGKVSIIL